MKKPRTIFLDPAKAGKFLQDSDALSTTMDVYRYGAKLNGDEMAMPFVELTPELLEILRKQDWTT